MIALLYFVQGLCHNVVGTIILTYPQIPNYFVLSVFDLSTIVFASKFIIGIHIFKFSSNSRNILVYYFWKKKNVDCVLLFWYVFLLVFSFKIFRLKIYVDCSFSFYSSCWNGSSSRCST
jgi:hypothetical protein